MFSGAETSEFGFLPMFLCNRSRKKIFMKTAWNLKIADVVKCRFNLTNTEFNDMDHTKDSTFYSNRFKQLSYM